MRLSKPHLSAAHATVYHIMARDLTQSSMHPCRWRTRPRSRHRSNCASSPAPASRWWWCAPSRCGWVGLFGCGVDELCAPSRWVREVGAGLGLGCKSWEWPPCAGAVA